MNATKTKRPTCKQFLEATNGRCRCRTFDKSDYQKFLRALKLATIHAEDRLPYYATDDAGGVATSYGSVTSTARWGIWTTPDGDIVMLFDRVPVSSRSVKCAYYLGERAYMNDFRDGQLK